MMDGYYTSNVDFKTNDECYWHHRGCCEEPVYESFRKTPPQWKLPENEQKPLLCPVPCKRENNMRQSKKREGWDNEYSAKHGWRMIRGTQTDVEIKKKKRKE